MIWCILSFIAGGIVACVILSALAMSGDGGAP